MNCKAKFGLLFTTILISNLLSQPINSEIGDITQPSAQETSYSKNTQGSVNLFTGQNSINIPLQNITEGPLALKVSLSYGSNGFKPSNIRSEAGHGWNMNVGGMITRTIQGLPDEYNETINSKYGYYEYGQELTLSNQDILNEIVEGVRDGERDIFNYSIPGYSGKFVLDSEGIMSIPKNDLQFEVYQTGGSFDGFKITTPSGIKYFFGKHDENWDTYPIRGSVNTASRAFFFHNLVYGAYSNA